MRGLQERRSGVDTDLFVTEEELVALLYQMLDWCGPFELASVDFGAEGPVPAGPGVYLFSESANKLAPNESSQGEDSSKYRGDLDSPEPLDCVLYLGKASNLKTRLPGYRFKPYLEIKRRPAGAAPVHKADRHKGRALLHAHQYFYRTIYVRWAETKNPEQVERELMGELRPVLNTYLVSGAD
jgi:hypothetical protein